MDKRAQAIESLKRFRKPDGDIFAYAKVTKITGDTCSVDIGGLELTKVRLKATDDGASDKFVIYPTVGSQVVVCANHGDLRDLFVCKVDDPEKILYKHKKVTVIIDSKNNEINLEGAKFTIKNDQENLKTLVSDLVNEIMKLTVTTGTGPSGTPINIQEFVDLSLRIPKLFK